MDCQKIPNFPEVICEWSFNAFVYVPDKGFQKVEFGYQVSVVWGVVSAPDAAVHLTHSAVWRISTLKIGKTMRAEIHQTLESTSLNWKSAGQRLNPSHTEFEEQMFLQAK